MSLAEKELNIFDIEPRNGFVSAFDYLIIKLTLVFLKLNDLLFDRIVANQFHNGNWPLLSNAVSAVCGLLFRSDVPPWVEMEDDVRSMEVKTGASSLKGNEHNVDVVLGVERLGHAKSIIGFDTAINVVGFRSCFF